MGTIRIQTAIPGPRSLEIVERRKAAVPRGVYNVTPIAAAKTEGATLTDVDGNVYIDFAGGIGVLNAGANHPEVVDAIKDQADRFLHTCFTVAMYDGYVSVAEGLNRLTPGAFPKKTLLVNSGAEAIENAVKLARRYTGRASIVTFNNAYHGRTLLTMTLTAKVSTYKYGFGPFAPEIYRLPACYPYRSPWPTAEEDARHTLAEVRRAIEDDIGAGQVAGIVVEPIQGEGGFIIQPPEFLLGLRELCDKHGIVLIADEVQTGFARTGRMFACEHFGLIPDLIATAKSLANGTPLAGVTGRAEIMDSAQDGGLGGTYGGNPLACAAAVKVIEIMEREDLPARSRAIGAQVLERFQSWVGKYALVGDARGLGAMCAIELVKDRNSKDPATAEAAAIFRNALESGLLLMKAGNANNVIRFLGSLAITDDQLTEGLDVLETSIARVSPGVA